MVSTNDSNDSNASNASNDSLTSLQAPVSFAIGKLSDPVQLAAMGANNGGSNPSDRGSQYLPQLPSNKGSGTIPEVQINPDVVVKTNPQNGPIVDGTYIMVAIAAATGIVKMVIPSMLTRWTSRSDAELQAKTDARKAELLHDEESQKVLHGLLEGFAKSNQENSGALYQAVVGQLTDAIERISDTQAELVAQVSNVADSQVSIADTQQRTLEVLLKVEQRLGIESPAAPTDRVTKRAAKVPKAATKNVN